MSDDGKNVLKLVKRMRELCQQVSLLLLTADEQMAKAEWISRKQAILKISGSIEEPEDWIPTQVFRNYDNKEYPHRLAYVSVLLDDPSKKYTITEPLVIAAFFDYRDRKLSDDDWAYWDSRVFEYLSQDQDLKANGQPFEFNRTMLTADRQGNIESGKFFAVPLTSIKNAEDVVSQITVRLINLLKGIK